jgi:Sugar (and other) transporter
MDWLGRKTIQMVGFVMMAITFAAIAFIPGVSKLIVPFVIIYGVSYFFTEFGPNSTTFVYPAEIFPVTARTTGHGVAAAAGKLGGFLGVFLFPIMMAPYACGSRGGDSQHLRPDRHSDHAAGDEGQEPRRAEPGSGGDADCVSGSGIACPMPRSPARALSGGRSGVPRSFY